MLSETKVITDGVLAVYYFGRLIAIIGAQGRILWRNRNYPLFLVDYIVANPVPTMEQARLN